MTASRGRNGAVAQNFVLPSGREVDFEVIGRIFDGVSEEFRKAYLVPKVSDETKKTSADITRMLLRCTRLNLKRRLESQTDNPEQGSSGTAARSSGQEDVRQGKRTRCMDVQTAKKDVEEMRKVSTNGISTFAAYNLYKSVFPPDILNCCSALCFINTISGTEESKLYELVRIHKKVKELWQGVEEVTKYVAQRKKGVGGSHMVYVALSREEREGVEGIRRGSERQRALRKVWEFARCVLPYLNGVKSAPTGTRCLDRKLCTNAICCLLQVSRKFLYSRKPKNNNTNLEEELNSLVDISGTRLRQFRRVGKRDGYAPLEELISFDCGCEEPCLLQASVDRLRVEYNEFAKLARGPSCQRNERRFLLNTMFCPLTNSTITVCDRALSQVFTVSHGLIADVRRTLNAMCVNPCLEDRDLLKEGVGRHYKAPNHPMNRYSDDVRENIECHRDMILRADPEGTTGVNVCRVYSPEINTQEKLREVLKRLHEEESGEEFSVSSSTLQRMIQEYLEKRNLRIVFKQSDHNACPTCKSGQHAVLQFHHEWKELERSLEKLLQESGTSREEVAASDMEARNLEVESLQQKVGMKKFQEDEAIHELAVHTQRDFHIRGYIKSLGDHFREVENEYRRMGKFIDLCPSWNSLWNHAILTHQDDMTKVDLPCFVDNGSADIMRLRFDVNAHVNAVNNEAIVFSHEQGTGSKNASAIMEEILLDHIIRCRGEGIKLVVSDNASVGKNWLCTIALPQYPGRSRVGRRCYDCVSRK